MHIYNNVHPDPTDNRSPHMPTAKKPAKPTTVAAYLESLPPDRRATISTVRTLVNARMPKGYSEFMSAGIIVWGIPLAEYPDTYNGHPIWYTALAAQKNYSTLYLMACYGSNELMTRLESAYKKAGKKFDMGKSCLHFKTPDDLVSDAVGDVIAAVPPKTYLAMYEKSHPPKKR
jgi:hypothetical protein